MFWKKIFKPKADDSSEAQQMPDRTQKENEAMGLKVDLRWKSASDIERMLRGWAKNGRIKSKTLMGRDYREINKKYASGELLVTSIDGIDVTDKNTQDTFEELHERKRIMTKREVMLRKGLTSEYQIKQAVKKGDLIRFDLLGRSAILYIE